LKTSASFCVISRRDASADTFEYKIGEIFSEHKNRIQSGANLREVINLIDALRFRTYAENYEKRDLRKTGKDICQIKIPLTIN
jgi:hypothetical protein